MSNLNANKTALKKAIKDFLESNEEFPSLKAKEKSFLVTTLTEFTCRAGNKFIDGAVKHADSDFFTETDMLQEAHFEVVDLLFYLAGKQTQEKQ
jgi:hypothetical protein